MRPAAKVDAMAEDQAAEFAALNAAAIDGGSPAATAPEPEPAASLAAELDGIAGALLAAVGPMFPSVKAIYSEEVTAGAAAAIAAVCQKHGWLSGGLMGEYAEEITALVICGPLAVATVQAVKADLAAMKPAAKLAPVVAVPPATTLDADSTGPAPVMLERG